MRLWRVIRWLFSWHRPYNWDCAVNGHFWGRWTGDGEKIILHCTNCPIMTRVWSK